MELAKGASVEELLGNLGKSHDLYTDAKLLIESIMLTAVDNNDKRILQQFEKIFSEQQIVCRNDHSSLYPLHSSNK